MNNLNVCSAHNYLYPRSRFNDFEKRKKNNINIVYSKSINYVDYVKCYR